MILEKAMTETHLAMVTTFHVVGMDCIIEILDINLKVYQDHNIEYIMYYK